MEHCPQGELFEHIQRGELKEVKAKAHFIQIVDAVRHLHSRGVVHLDLMPENILFDQFGHCRISSFGLSQAAVDCDPLTAADALFVSPYYAAPEVMGGVQFDGRKADGWSLGVVLCVMVTGHMPWRERHAPKLLGEIRRAEYEVPQNVTTDCTDLIRMLMQPHPDDRISLDDVMNHPWLAGASLTQTPCVARRVISLRRLDECFLKDDVFEPRTVVAPRRRCKSFEHLDFAWIEQILAGKFPEPEVIVDDRTEGMAVSWKGSTRTVKARSAVSRPRSVVQRTPKKPTPAPPAWLKESLRSLVDHQKTSLHPVDAARRRKYVPH
jgi:serine/threonine protein kinase